MTAYWQHWWSRTMAAQLILVLFGAMIAYQVASLIVLGRGDVIHPVSRRHVIAQAVDMWRLAGAQLQAVPGAAQASQLLAALDRPGTHVRVAAASNIEPHQALPGEEANLHASLLARTGLAADAVRVRFEPAEGDDQQARLAISMRLADGHWMNSAQQPMTKFPWWRSNRFSLPMTTLLVLALGFAFVHGTLRAIRKLARVAERVGRGEQVAPLPLSGPRETRELTASFDAMRQRLARHIEDQAQLIGTITHDLRTLIATLRLRAELVDDADLRTAMQRTLVDMEQMVEQSLRMASDEAHAEVTIETDLAGLLRDIAAEQGALGQDVRLHATAPASVPYRCRPLGLRRALTNLVENAVRYGSRARIGIEHARAEAGGGAVLRIVIDDDGPGIAPAQLDNVFKPFFRLDRASGGTGLGLTIARSCVEAHGGSLQLHNRGGSGLRAVALLPAS